MTLDAKSAKPAPSSYPPIDRLLFHQFISPTGSKI